MIRIVSKKGNWMKPEHLFSVIGILAGGGISGIRTFNRDAPRDYPQPIRECPECKGPHFGVMRFCSAKCAYAAGDRKRSENRAANSRVSNKSKRSR